MPGEKNDNFNDIGTQRQRQVSGNTSPYSHLLLDWRCNKDIMMPTTGWMVSSMNCKTGSRFIISSDKVSPKHVDKWIFWRHIEILNVNFPIQIFNSRKLGKCRNAFEENWNKLCQTRLATLPSFDALQYFPSPAITSFDGSCSVTLSQVYLTKPVGCSSIPFQIATNICTG